MPHYVVQCGYHQHYGCVIDLEAATLEEALELAIKEAGNRSDWRPSDECGPTFVDAVGPLGEPPWDGPWDDAGMSQIPVPSPFREEDLYRNHVHAAGPRLLAALKRLLEAASLNPPHLPANGWAELVAEVEAAIEEAEPCLPAEKETV